MAFDFNKIKGLFIVEEESINPQQSVKEEKKAQAIPSQKEPQKVNFAKTNNQTPPPIPTSQTTLLDQGAFNQKVFEQLTKAISDSNLPGEDYLEFVESLKAMQNIPLDEKIKMQTVLATLSTKGLTTQKVIESGDYYLKILENEKTKFNDAVKNQTDGQINKKQKEIQSLENLNKTKAEQIAALTEEIKKNQEEIIKIKNDITESEAKINSTANSFNFTFDLVANQIKQTVEKIKTL